MLILITGATGFVGRALVLRLQRDGHRVRALVRSPARALDLLGADVELAPTSAGLGRAVEGCDAVINLAGESVASGRWTAARKRVLWDSRVKLTEDLVAAIAAAQRRPGVLVSASAVGYYGDRGDEILDEGSAPGSDYLGSMCQAWEDAAHAARAHGVRVCCVRVALVLGLGGGVLERLVPLVRAGVAGPLGSGAQWFPWVHLHDLVELFAQAVVDPRYAGAINSAAPEAVTNREFTRRLARRLGRWAVVPAPGFALRVALGEAASALLAGQRLGRSAALGLGFTFAFPTLDAALADLFDEGGRPRFDAAGARPESGYLAARGATRTLRQRAVLPAPIDDVCGFFSRAENLGPMTPAGATMRIATPRPLPVGAGERVEYTLRVGPAPLRWVTEFEAWDLPRRFVDVQVRGPFASWWHEHRFEPLADGSTQMDDTVYYRVPLGPLGWIADRLFVRPRLRAIFGFRAQALRLRFGAPTA